jgi:predicted RNA-binding protein
MCLSTAWELGDGGDKKMLCEHVAGVSVAGNTIMLTDLMGNEISVKGILQGIDLIKNTITIGTNTAVNAVKRYERIREIFNTCSNSQMRDVDIEEVETADVDAAVKEFCNGKEVSCEKFVRSDGSVVFNIINDGLNQRVSYAELGKH